MLANLDNPAATISDKLRATLGVLRKVTRDHASVTADDMRGLRKAGVSRAQIEDALEVCFAFNVITRLADTFCFEVGTAADFEASARHLLARGYK